MLAQKKTAGGFSLAVLKIFWLAVHPVMHRLSKKTSLQRKAYQLGF
ncbi:MAG: hypothetical protein IKP58_19085 [Victivallales bacterium]|nr:hypothetical protein [Victivallales bacterium]